MNLKKFQMIDALISEIEEQELKIYENNALMKYYNQFEEEQEQRFHDMKQEKFFCLFKKKTIQWKAWLMASLNVQAHNLHFYQNRLKKFLSED